MKTIVMSLGGSIIVPKEIQVKFLKNFKEFILKFLKKDCRFIIVTGGGSIARNYIKAASETAKISDEDKDWLGIHSTRLNAHLLITIFRNAAYPIVLDDPHKPIKNHWRLLIASGWRPGCSTDTDSTLMARRFKIKEIINAGNISFVFDKDAAKNSDAKLFKQISWKDYRKIIGSSWTPGMSTPFDPIASKIAQKLKIRVLILKGTEIKNLEKAIAGKNFDGTIIS